MSLNLAETLAVLEARGDNISAGQFKATQIPGFAAHYVASDASGLPSILLGALPVPMYAPIRLSGFEARFAVPCRISIGSQSKHETLTVVACLASDRESQDYFLHLCETIIRIVGQVPSLAQVVDAVHRLVALFKHLSHPATRSVTGLIGELYAISQSAEPAAAVQAWRTADQDRFDFALDDLRLEVKATSDRTRAHHFSTEQCSPPSGILGMAISIFIEATGGGLSLLELIRQIENRLGGNDDLILKLQYSVAATLGESLRSALSTRFDESLARSSLQLYDLATIPAVRADIPVEVSQVRFRSDLTRTPTIPAETIAAISTRARGILPPVQK
jgi:hypothetical protein